MCCDMEWTLAISGNRAVKTLDPSKKQQLYTSNSKRKQLLFGKIREIVKQLLGYC